MPKNSQTEARPADESVCDLSAIADASRRAGELYVEILAGLEHRPIQPRFDALDLKEAFRGTLGERGVGLSGALDEFRSTVLPSSTAVPSPMYFGLLNCSPLPAAPLADLLVSALNGNAGAHHQGPAAWAAEAETVRAFADLVAPGSEMSGMLLPGGTFANLQGLVLARDSGSPRPTPGSRRVYTSEACHFSVNRSAVVAGFAPGELVAIPSTGRGCLDPRALAERIRRDVADGARPLAVVATAGTTGTGAIDPLHEIADVCARHGLWLHVDACYGGGALLLDELRPALRGIERADSVALDPHKWFFCPLTASLLLLRRPGVDLAQFDVDAPYIPQGPPGVPPDAWRRGIPTSRRATSLTVWLTLRAHGFGVVRDTVRRNVSLARRLEGLLEARGFAVLPGGRLSIACARFEPPGLPPEATDRLQDRVAAEVCASGRAWFATTRSGGKTWLCFRSTNLYTRERHVETLAEIVAETSARCAEELTG